MRFLGASGILFLFTACATAAPPATIGDYQFLNPGNGVRPPTCMSAVSVYASADKVPADRTDVALLTAPGDASTALQELRWLAARTGGTGLLFGSAVERTIGATVVAPGSVATAVQTRALSVWVPADTARVNSACRRTSVDLTADDRYTLWRSIGLRLRVEGTDVTEPWLSRMRLQEVTGTDIQGAYGLNRSRLPLSRIQTFRYDTLPDGETILYLKLRDTPP